MATLENVELTNFDKNQTTDKKATAETKKVDPLEFDTIEFKAASGSIYTTTRNLGASIAQTLRRVSDDVVACTVYPDPKTGLKATLILTNKPSVEGKTKLVVTPKQKEIGKGVFARMTERSTSDFRQLLELTDEGQAKLADIIPAVYFRNNNPIYNFKQDGTVNWTNASKDFVEGGYSLIGGEPHAYKAIIVDLPKFLQKMYGRTNEKGETFLYTVNVVRPESNNNYPLVGQTNISYIIQITQINEAIVEANFNVTNGQDVDAFSPSFTKQF